MGMKTFDQSLWRLYRRAKSATGRAALRRLANEVRLRIAGLVAMRTPWRRGLDGGWRAGRAALRRLRGRRGPR